MGQYFFVLGRNPTLSAVELLSVISRLDSKLTVKYLSEEVLVISVNIDLNTNSLMSRLGGTVKTGKIIKEIDWESSETEFENILSYNFLQSFFINNSKGKVHFGLSLYNAGNSTLYSKLENILKESHVTVKENLKTSGIKSGFVKIKDTRLSSVSVVKNELLTHGFEMVLVAAEDKLLVGKTLQVQEFAQFSLRDYQRPAKDKRSGIMPPKLARMMLNICLSDTKMTVLDPFCGSGTILQEALMLGFRKIMGSDISQKAISDTQQNLDFIVKNYPYLERNRENIMLKKVDIRHLSQEFPPQSADVVVTEPFLGPPLFQKPNSLIVKRIFSDLKELYLAAFNQFAKILKNDGKVMIIFPAFENNSQILYLEILKEINRMGWRQLEFIPEFKNQLPEVKFTSRNSILYGSGKQFVLREILFFSVI